MAAFSDFIGAVKQRNLTPQYVTLAALFVLGAHATPVTAREVKDILELYVKAHVPANVNDVLRKNPSLVTPAEKSSPLRWKLTQGGVVRLRELSGLELATSGVVELFDYDVAIVCALEHPELSAVFAAFNGESAWTSVGDARMSHVYRETSLAARSGAPLRVVATTASSMGLTAAAIATTQLIFQFRPRLVLMVGIAAGTRGADKRFGDVLVADPSVDYNSGKVAMANGIREFLPDPYPIGLNARLRCVLQKYRRPHVVFEEIRKKWGAALPAGPNRIHIGPLGAADQVLDDESRILEIQKNWRKLIGVEMEAYGVYRACHEAPEPKPRFVSMKSVCDFAAEKSDSWQEYAAHFAAHFALHFITNEWSELWPIPKGGDSQ
jgi:nucleoside phosphorylase